MAANVKWVSLACCLVSLAALCAVTPRSREFASVPYGPIPLRSIDVPAAKIISRIASSLPDDNLSFTVLQTVEDGRAWNEARIPDGRIVVIGSTTGTCLVAMFVYSHREERASHYVEAIRKALQIPGDTVDLARLGDAWSAVDGGEFRRGLVGDHESIIARFAMSTE